MPGVLACRCELCLAGNWVGHGLPSWMLTARPVWHVVGEHAAPRAPPSISHP